MAFRELTEILDPLILPIKGKRYEIPPVSMQDGLKLQTEEDIAALPTAEFRRIFLGAAFDQMVEDGVSAVQVSRACLTALCDFQAGRSVAEVMWETGGDPKALRAWEESLPKPPTTDRLPEVKKSRRRAAGSTTPRPASTSTTKKSQPES